MAKFEYRGRDRSVESVVQKSKQATGNYDRYTLEGVPSFKPKEGENCVRILPPTWKDTQRYGDGWEIQIHLHSNVGVDNSQYLCLDKMNDEDCPICAARRDATDTDEADALRVGWRALCWVVSRDDEKAGPQLWAMPPTLFRDICAASVDKKGNTPILIDDPEEGYDLYFHREGSGLRTKYSRIEVVRDPSPLHDNQKLQDRWLDYIMETPLPDVLQFFPADHIEKVLFGRVDRGSEGGEPRKPIRGRRNEDDGKGEDAPSGRDRRPARGGGDEGGGRGGTSRRPAGRDLMDENPDDGGDKPLQRSRTTSREPAEEPTEDTGRNPRRRNTEPESGEARSVPRRKPAEDPAEDGDPQDEALDRTSGAARGRLTERLSRRASR